MKDKNELDSTLCERLALRFDTLSISVSLDDYSVNSEEILNAELLDVDRIQTEKDIARIAELFSKESYAKVLDRWYMEEKPSRENVKAAPELSK